MKLSIVTATYNDTAGLKETLESLNQLLRSPLSWEHVIVDSSPSQNDKIIEDWSEKTAVKHLKLKPEGIYSAFNSGISEAEGEYVWLLNGGDRLKNARDLRTVIEALEKDPGLGLVFAQAQLFRNGNYMYCSRPRESFLMNIIGANRICHQSIIYRRSALLKAGLFATDLKLAGDYEHHFQCYLAGLRNKYVREAIVEFDMGGQSSQYIKVFSEFKTVHRRLAGRLPLSVTLANEAVRTASYLRTRGMKMLKASSAGSLLKPLWIGWNRRGDV